MTVIDESLTAKGFTPQGSVPLVYGRPRTIESITIHHWGAFGQTHDGVNNFFVNGPGETSAHFVASANRINCLVYPWDAAWHAGNAVGNASSIGVECRPEHSDGDYATVAELVRFLRDTYGPNLPLIPHRNWQSTACPGTWDLARIDRQANALNTPVPAPKPPAPKPPMELDMQLKHVRDSIQTDVALKANTSVLLKDGTANWNLAADGLGLGYYDCNVFIRGKGLEDGETLTVQVFIVTNGNYSGYFPQRIAGSANGEFDGQISFKSPLLSSARLEVQVKSTTDLVIESYGADKFVFTP